MALSSFDIDRIHREALATLNRKYYADDGKIYIGTIQGTLRLLTKALEVPFSKTKEIQETNVQKAIESLSNTLETDVVRSLESDNNGKLAGDVRLRSGTNTDLVQIGNAIEVNFNKPSDIIYDDSEIISDTETLENRVDSLETLLRRLLIQLDAEGFKLEDDELLNELEIAYQEITD